MDNILKMLLGVLSVAGLIALVIPAKNPLPPQVAEAPMEATAPALEEIPPQPSPDPVQFGSDPASDFQIGTPTIDGNPMQPDFGLPFGTSAQSESSNQYSSNADATQTGPGGYTPPVFIMPGATPQNDATESNNTAGE